MSSECEDQMLNMMSCSLNSAFVSRTTAALYTNTANTRSVIALNLDPDLLSDQHGDLITPPLAANQHSHLFAARSHFETQHLCRTAHDLNIVNCAVTWMHKGCAVGHAHGHIE